MLEEALSYLNLELWNFDLQNIEFRQNLSYKLWFQWTLYTTKSSYTSKTYLISYEVLKNSPKTFSLKSKDRIFYSHKNKQIIGFGQDKINIHGLITNEQVSKYFRKIANHCCLVDSHYYLKISVFWKIGSLLKFYFLCSFSYKSL